MDRKYILTAFGYAILGMVLGIFMAMTKNHGQLVTHTHIMLVGFVVSFIYALCHLLWLNNSISKLAVVQFYVHQTGAALLFVGLFLVYGNIIAVEILDPVLGIASIIVLLGMILMTILFLKSA